MECFLLLFVGLGATPCQTDMPKLFRENHFTCTTLAEAANHFIDLGEEAAVKELESLTLDWTKDRKDGFSRNERIGWVCRILFQPKGKRPLRQPAFGALGLPWNSMPLSKWPLYPLAASGNSYFVLSEGYSLAGFPQNPKDYLTYCRTNGTFRTQRVPNSSGHVALKNLEQLRQSDAWKSIKWEDSGKGFAYTINADWIWEFIRAQADDLSAK